MDLADYVHREVMTYIPDLIQTPEASPTVIDLFAGTQEYAISESQMQIDYASYLTAAGVGSKLLETDIPTLNKMNPTWRTDPASTPTQFYLSSSGSGLLLGLYPCPSASTSGGYPVVWVFGSQRPTSPLILSSTVPPTCLNSLLYIEGISYYAAIETRPQMAAAFKATYMEQIMLNRKYVQTRNEGLKVQRIRNSRYDNIPVEAASP